MNFSLKPLATTAFSLSVLGCGMLAIVATTAPKFGTFSGGRHGYDARENLRSLQTAEVSYHAAYGKFVAVDHPYPETDPPPRGQWPDDNPFRELGWRPVYATTARLWVEVAPDGADFTAHAKAGEQHWIIHAKGDPERAAP